MNKSWVGIWDTLDLDYLLFQLTKNLFEGLLYAVYVHGTS